jgi:uncharacterized coiled-coil protein SlyX
MKNGLNRFGFYTQQVEGLMNQAREQRAPAMWLFKNNARTPFFMLEGLAKIYAGMHNTKKFGKLKEHFKLVEDGLGQIDYYNWLSIAFASKKEISAQCRQYVRNQLDQRVILLNKVLADEDWLSDNNKRIKKMTKKLSEASWLNPVKEVEAITAFYEKSIAGISEFVARTNYQFDNVEKDVHELRRKLRWLSIYPQALQGAIQYGRETRAAAHLKKYLTEEIINSPYNKLPAAGNNTSFIMLHKSCFLALSWMIEKLGIIKDEGLLLTGLCEAIKQSTGCTEEAALKKAYLQLGRKQRRLREILDDAEVITKTFFEEKNLQHLLAGIKTTSK